MSAKKDLYMQIRSYLFGFTLFLGLVVTGIWVAADLSDSVLIIGDNVWFQPIIHNYAKSGQLAHPFMSPVLSNGSTGGPLLWHGWLMPELTGMIARLLLPDISVAQTSFSSHLLAGIIFIGFAVLIKERLRFAPLYLPIFFTLFLYQSGRPELAASLFMLIFLWLQTKQRTACHIVATALLLAATAASSPNAGIMLAFYLVLKETSSGRPQRAQWKFVLALFFLAPIFLATLTVVFTDLPLLGWLKGLAAHSERILSRDDGNFLAYYVFNTKLPFVFVFLALLALWLIARARKSPAGMFWLVALLFICFSYFTAIAAPPMVYNIVWLMPLILYDLGVERATPRMTTGLVSVLAFVFTLSTVLLTFGKIENLRSGVTASQLTEAFVALPNQPTLLRSAKSLGIIAILEPEIGLARASADTSIAQIRIALQTITGRSVPQIGPSECLLKSTYHSDAANTGDVLMRRLRQDWAFAIISLAPCAPR